MSKWQEVEQLESGNCSIEAAFSGIDVKVIIDDACITEVSDITWTKKVDHAYSDSDVRGEIKMKLFAHKNPLEQLFNKRVNIELIFLNEVGESKVYFFPYAKFNTVKGGIGVDTLVEECTIPFVADGVYVFEDACTTTEEMLNFIRAHEGTHKKEIEHEVKFYKNELMRSLIKGDRFIISREQLIKIKEQEEKLSQVVEKLDKLK